MAGAKEIRNANFKSIKSTQKITSAMEMVAASKMRKAQERMETSSSLRRASIRQVVGHISLTPMLSIKHNVHD